MKKKLLLFVVLLFGLTAVHAQGNGTLTVANIQNAVPGYRGSLDLVVTSDNLYAAYQFDIKLPVGLTYDGYADGPLINGHTNVTVSDQGNNTRRFTGYANPTANFTAKTGTMLTIYFTVSSTATGTLPGGLLSGIHFSDGVTVDYAMANHPFSVTIGSAVTLTEDETSAPDAISGVDVTIERALKGGVWNTLVLPFPMTADQIATTFGAGTQVAAYEGDEAVLEGSSIVAVKMNFSTVTSIAAHTPYIIKVPSAMDEFTVSGVSITTAGGELKTTKGQIVNIPPYIINQYMPSDMIGTYATNTVIPAGKLYLIDNEFCFSQGSTKLKAFHAYFDVSNTATLYTAATPAPAISLVINGTTGISSATLNNQVGMTNEKYYTVQGVQVAQPRRGLYIVNGRKVIIK